MSITNRVSCQIHTRLTGLSWHRTYTCICPHVMIGANSTCQLQWHVTDTQQCCLSVLCCNDPTTHVNVNVNVNVNHNDMLQHYMGLYRHHVIFPCTKQTCVHVYFVQKHTHLYRYASIFVKMCTCRNDRKSFHV